MKENSELECIPETLQSAVVQAYRVACHLGDVEEDMEAAMRIVSSAVFNKVLIFMVKEVQAHR